MGHRARARRRGGQPGAGRHAADTFPRRHPGRARHGLWSWQRGLSCQAALVMQGVFHDFFPLAAKSVLVADQDLDIGAGIVDGVGINALLDERVAVFFAEINALDTPALKTSLRLVKAEIHETLFGNRLLIGIKESGRLISAIEGAESVAIEEVRRCGGKTDHTRVEVINDFCEAVEERAMRLVKDDQVEEAWAELLET